MEMEEGCTHGRLGISFAVCLHDASLFYPLRSGSTTKHIWHHKTLHANCASKSLPVMPINAVKAHRTFLSCHVPSSIYLRTRPSRNSRTRPHTRNAQETARVCAYLNTLPSAHSYALPLTSIGLSHAHWSLTNSRSASFLGSSLVKE